MEFLSDSGRRWSCVRSLGVWQRVLRRPLVSTTYADFKGGDYAGTGKDYAYQNYKNTTIQIKYDIAKVGTVGLTFIGNQAEDSSVFSITAPSTFPDDIKKPFVIKDIKNDSPTMYAYFGIKSGEKLSVDFGIGYQFADEFSTTSRREETPPYISTTKQTYTINEPLAAGFGLNFTSGSFGIKTRILGKFLGNLQYDYSYTTDVPLTPNVSYSNKISTGYEVLFDIMPSIAINEKLTLNISAGLGVTGGKEDVYYVEDTDILGVPTGNPKYINSVPQFRYVTEDSSTKWHLNPFIVITPNYWSGAFFAGLKLESPYGNDDKDKAYVNWSIPIGIAVSF